MPETDISPPLDCDAVDQYDLLTATRVARAVSAAAAFRNVSVPSGYSPPPSAPSADPQPTADAAGTSPLASNRVGHYDALTATHQTQAEASSENASEDADTFDDYMASANARFGALKSGSNSIPAKFQALTNQYGEKYTADRPSVSQRSNMSVFETIGYDMGVMQDGWDDMADDAQNDTIGPAMQRIGNRIDGMPGSVHNGLIDVSDVSH